ncbi:MAG: histidinol-phosphate transaminase [Candidatus Paceibacterota bacterium]
MNPFANEQIRKMGYYSPPLEGRSKYKGFLLDFNERTVPVSKKITKALADFANGKRVQVYPEYGDICKIIAKYSDLDASQVMITNGSDQGIDLIFRTFTKKNDKVIINFPTFPMFKQCADIAGNNVVSINYDKNLRFPFEKVIKAIDRSVKMIVICNPNNPTGTLVDLTDIEKILKKALGNGVLVYIDEAYFEFSGVTAAGFIMKYPNLIISRTFSKAFGLASLRIGYLLSSAVNINEMMKVRGPYDVNTFAIVAVEEALKNVGYMKNYVKEVMQKAKPMVEKFFADNCVEFYPSRANYVLFKPINADEVFNKLKTNGILTRPRSGKNIDKTIRLSIGTEQQMLKFIKIYKKLFLKNRLKKYAFLDRDGALIFEPQDTFQIDSLDKLEILDGVIDGLQMLISKGYRLVLISNQDGLGTKSFPLKSFEIPQNEFLKKLLKNGIKFENIFICPHFAEENCKCRKPKTGLVDGFLENNKIDFKNSLMIGDRETDRQFAKNIGIKFIKMETNGSFKSIFNQLSI